MAFTNSPLFQEASRQIQQAARRQFRSSDLGRLLQEVESVVKYPTRPGDQLRGVLRKFAAAARPENAIRQLMGAEFGGLVREVAKYSKGSTTSQRLIQEFLTQLGPAGNLIKSLVDPSKKAGLTGELRAAMNLIRAFGGETLAGKGKEWSSLQDVERELGAIIQRLESYGFAVVSSKGPPRRAPQPEGDRKTIDVNMGYRHGSRRVPENHPLVTGEMVRCPGSTNVYEFGYDNDAGYLYVRFQAPHEKGAKGGAGSLYRYSGVAPDEFLSLYQLRNKGGGDGPGSWVWDALRIRGTVSGHQKDYELVGIMGNYVPRKATVRPIYETLGKRGQTLKHPRKIGMEEWYEQRHVKTHEGRWARSVLPTTRVASTTGPRH
jgi:hypothetical protein